MTTFIGFLKAVAFHSWEVYLIILIASIPTMIYVFLMNKKEKGYGFGFLGRVIFRILGRKDKFLK